MEDKTNPMQELGAFLCRLRNRSRPHQTDTQRQRRRTPGLRRIDVAEKTHIHVDTYAKIEQGNYVPPLEMLKDILVALDAIPDETAYAMNLYVSIGKPVPFYYETPTLIPPHLQQLLDDEEPRPAYLINKRWDIIASNRFVPIVFPMIPRLDDPDIRNGNRLAMNVLSFMFLHPLSQEIIVDWEAHIVRIVKEFRADFAKHSTDQEVLALIAYLKQQSEQFTTLWQTPDVTRKCPSVKEVNHPELGRLHFLQLGARIDYLPDLMLVFYKPYNDETKHALHQIQL